MERTFSFESMEKTQSKVSVGIYGPSGGGKTTAAFKIAMGIRDELYPNQKLKDIAIFIDTENKAANKSFGRTVGGELLEDMTIIDFKAPYDIVDLKRCIEFCISKGFKIIIIDTYTKFWSGDAGVLDRVAEIDASNATAKKAYGAWSEKEIIQKKSMIKDVADSRVHMIYCYRAKTEYLISKNDRGRTVIEAVGVKEDTQADVRYEHDVMLSISKDNWECTVVKDRIGYLELRLTSANPVEPVSVQTGRDLAKIVSQGVSAEEVLNRKREMYINYILDEKSHNSSKVKQLETSLKREMSKELLEKLEYEKLKKMFEFIR